MNELFADLVLSSGGSLNVEKHVCLDSDVHHELFIPENASLDLTIHLSGTGSLELSCILSGPKAFARIVVLHQTYDNDQITVVTQQHHCARDTESHIEVRSALRDAAHASYYGNISIEDDAHQSSSSFFTKTLKLSEQSSVFSKPDFSVKNNHVRCSHGAAVGHIDQHKLEYLVSRGMNVDVAKQMIVDGFLGL